MAQTPTTPAPDRESHETVILFETVRKSVERIRDELIKVIADREIYGDDESPDP